MRCAPHNIQKRKRRIEQVQKQNKWSFRIKVRGKMVPECDRAVI